MGDIALWAMPPKDFFSFATKFYNKKMFAT